MNLTLDEALDISIVFNKAPSEDRQCYSFRPRHYFDGRYDTPGAATKEQSLYFSNFANGTTQFYIVSLKGRLRTVTAVCGRGKVGPDPEGLAPSVSGYASFTGCVVSVGVCGKNKASFALSSSSRVRSSERRRPSTRQRSYTARMASGFLPRPT